MGRSGSTLICKCLGCMDNIKLLSEIHPLGINLFNPLSQAHEWFGLLNPHDIEKLQHTAIPFVEAIKLVELRSRQRGETLIIRDWGHLDFTGFPILDNPSYELGLAKALKQDFRLVQTAIVRHPLDQWLSLFELEAMADTIDSGQLSLAFFLKGYLEFAKHCQKIGYIRYEDFTRQPESIMQEMCNNLDIPYDRGFINHWHEYRSITGDVSSARGGNEIGPLKRRPFESGLMASLDREPAYHEALKILGYSE